MANSNEEDKWTKTIQKLFANGRLSSHQCVLYSRNSREDITDQGMCGCQRPIRHHSFDGTCPEQRPKPEDWNLLAHTRKLKQLIYYSTASRKFLRCACENKNDIDALYELMTSVCGQPKFIISVYGGRKHFTMDEDIEKEFMDSLAQAAMTSGTWIITSGLNNGAARLIGIGIDRLRALTDTKERAILLGISWWGNVAERTRHMVTKLQNDDSVPSNDQINLNTLFLFDDKDEHSLEKNHTHFLLLDDGNYLSQYIDHEADKISTTNNLQSESCKQDQNGLAVNTDGSGTSKLSSEQKSTHPSSRTKYPKEMQRVDFVSRACETDECYAVTIIVEGGSNTCIAIQKDIEMKRPVVLIQGSGKIADVMASLMEVTAMNKCTPPRVPSDEEIKHNFKRFPMGPRTEKDDANLIEQIKKIMDPVARRYLTVFRVNGERNLKQTIWHAIFKAHFAETRLYRPMKHNNSLQSAMEYSSKMDLLELAIKWNTFDQATDLLDDLQYSKEPRYTANLFKQALQEDRPAFVDYFLRSNYDPRRTLDLTQMTSASPYFEYQTSISMASKAIDTVSSLTSVDLRVEYQNQLKLCEDGLAFTLQLYRSEINSTKWIPRRQFILKIDRPQTEHDLDEQYRQLIGSYMQPMFMDAATIHLNANRYRRHCCCFRYTCGCRCRNQNHPTNEAIYELVWLAPTTSPILKSLKARLRDGILAEELVQTMLRDLLYWSLLTGRIDMAKVFLLHIKTRICAALTCVAVLRTCATRSVTSDEVHFYEQQAEDFGKYATDCINTCYLRSERKACELLICQRPLFGDMTCLQVAIASRSKSFINTDCFDQVLNRIWYKKLSRAEKSSFQYLRYAFAFFSFGLLAPWTLLYCSAEDVNAEERSNGLQRGNEKIGNNVSKSSNPSEANSETSLSCQLSNKGVNYYTRYTKNSPLTWDTYKSKLSDFHQSPMVKMCYHFIGYIWFLLVYSYVVLFKLNLSDKSKRGFHWTEGYIIVTILTMLIEDIRRNIFYEITYMYETHHYACTRRLLRFCLKTVPYSLFIIAITFWHLSSDSMETLKVARIMLAVDLELWYLYSLKFISAIKILSPKVFMLRNMLYDLFGFFYVAVVCIAAYGVASRAMIKQGQMEFSFQSIFENVFYTPYWFLYSEANDEKTMLDGMISNSSSGLVAEAITTHVFLALHMLLINILLLNLLIAVFATTINKVQNNAEYFYRRQRYIITREYFEKPIIPVPPFIVFCYVSMIIKYVCHRWRSTCLRKNRNANEKYPLIKIFKMIPINPRFMEKCIAFEHAATYDYARRVVENKKEQTYTIL